MGLCVVLLCSMFGALLGQGKLTYTFLEDSAAITTATFNGAGIKVALIYDGDTCDYWIER